MIYIICTIKQDTEKIMLYRVYDTCSDSVMLVSPESLKAIISNNRAQVVNAQLQNNNILLKEWANGIASEENAFNSHLAKGCGPSYVLISTKYFMCKLIGSDGTITKKCKEDLNILVQQGKIANCTQTKGSIKLKSEDTYEIHWDTEFDKYIKSKYERFIAKTILLGYRNISFEYEIENREVRLKNYTGLNNNVILPPFITAIMKDAFRGKYIKTIRLNHGLKVIGEAAFYHAGSSNSLEHIEIPETVEIIGDDAFTGNRKLAKSDGTINTERFKLLSDKTVIISQSL